ncbi:hypothetical protein GQX73_g1523 [Xylaria multiplex]|uniref:DUF6536 domain-containing protein n=1 Tax=Xylaria multiplex TaxID=323545 RepID=A0A7C8IW82_9PEZI|nr:hypothetical protein GQX73_g1523 [Xylaria multiplex]
MQPLMRQHDNTTDNPLIDHNVEEEDPPQPSENVTTVDSGSTSFRVHDFADIQRLAGWFPRINDSDTASWRIRLSKRNKALLLQIALITLTLTTNVVLVVYASLKYPTRDGVGLIYAGNCDTVHTSNRYIHLLINVLSTGMLSASNFCIQLQVSPTRADVDRVHEHNSWLDIGILSIKNLKYISRWRLASCIVLALSSLPIHLIFNAAVFESRGSNDYTIAVVKDSFLNGASWDLSTAERNRRGDPGWDDYRINPKQNYQRIIADIQGNITNSLYDAKNTSACYALYDDYWAVQGNAVILVKNETVQQNKNDSLLLYVSVTPRWDDWAKNMWAASNGTGRFVAFSPPPPITTWFLGPPRYEVSRCLVQVLPPEATMNRCRLLYSAHILYTVVVFNLIKVLTMLSIWGSRKIDERRRKAIKGEGDARPTESITAPREAVLATLGDAVASFMREADKTTKNMCLVTKHDIVKSLEKRPSNRKGKKDLNPESHPRRWKVDNIRWMSVVTRKQWFYLILLYTISLTALYVILARSFTSLRQRLRSETVSLSFLRSLGFGSVTPYTYLNLHLPRGDPLGLLINVLIINSPQLVFSILYSLYGAILTTFLIQREFSLMYSHRKALRVSEPVGIQRSSYFISLPLRYGIPLNVSSALLHWLISQSFFISRITALKPDGIEDYENTFSTLGNSPIAIIASTF